MGLDCLGEKKTFCDKSKHHEIDFTVRDCRLSVEINSHWQGTVNSLELKEFNFLGINILYMFQNTLFGDVEQHYINFALGLSVGLSFFVYILFPFLLIFWSGN